MEVKRIFDILDWQLQQYPQTECLAGKYNDAWKHWSTAEVIELSQSLALGLLNAGIKPGDKVGMMSENCVEWTLADQAIMRMGGIVVPLYPTSSESDLAFVINHAEIKLLFVQKQEHFQKIGNISAQLPGLKSIYTFNAFGGGSHWRELLRPVDDSGRRQLKDIQDPIRPDDLATIIYTSGTTGDPKGVMLSHHNITSNVIGTEIILPIHNKHRGLSFLPLSHIFERMVVYTYLYMGVSVYYGESMDKIGDNIREVKPHVFTAVPRLLEKVFDRIMAKGAELKGPKRALFNWAVKLGLQWEPDGKNGKWYEFKLKICNIVFKKWREALGNEVIAVCSGSAALQPRLLRIFNAAGIPLVEGYGLTETSPVISVGGYKPHTFKVGYVGQLLKGGVVKIAEDGEILFKGPNLMLGYFKREDLTAAAIDENGWFHTGDIGEMDKDGFLRITDRKKEIFKTSGGKYIAPQVLENKMKESPYMEQIVVIGENRKFPCALVVPAFGVVRDALKASGIKVPDDNAQLISTPEVVQLLDAEIERINASLGNFERIKKIALLPRELTIDGGELTPSLKLKRKTIDKHFAAEIEKIYVD
jgi:long-chain acyl-CoA synthetase